MTAGTCGATAPTAEETRMKIREILTADIEVLLCEQRETTHGRKVVVILLESSNLQLRTTVTVSFLGHTLGDLLLNNRENFQVLAS